MRNITFSIISLLSIFLVQCSSRNNNLRVVNNFNNDWKFSQEVKTDAYSADFNDSEWRMLNLPHDWSIEGAFNESNPSTVGGGALPGGIGWYRKSFNLPESDKGKIFSIEFDGIYMNSEVWINGNYLGKRPNGYISFSYELSPFLNYGKTPNLVAVKVDNSQQPNSRWYSGSGIYRNVRLVSTGKIHIDQWGTHISTPLANAAEADINIVTSISNQDADSMRAVLKTSILNPSGQKVGESLTNFTIAAGSGLDITQNLNIANPELWSVNSPVLYSAESVILINNKPADNYTTRFGIRSFSFESETGFTINGESLKIKGVCNHHDLGCLGAAINSSAIERQLRILKEMGCNAIRTSHNPPAPELLDLCDEMGFLVMDEAFDMWKKSKTKYDYSLYWDEWHRKDLRDQVLRDRNHPSVIIWSIGNEIPEQWDSSGVTIARELRNIVLSLDNTRPITAGCNNPYPENYIISSGALDLIGYNYKHEIYKDFPLTYPGKKFIASETTSALASRGHYDMPADSVREWPVRWDLPFTGGNIDNSCSAYDNCHAPWGSTHTESLDEVMNQKFLSGMFVWTGFDYLGEPTPYGWPSRSSYFGIVDLAGFPKDAYYLYQSMWTDKPVLHVSPHWNWNENQNVDVVVYTNCEEVELYLNGKSLGNKKRSDKVFILHWNVPFENGVLSAAGITGKGEILNYSAVTAGKPSKIELIADKPGINAKKNELAFITVRVLDEDGILVPTADNEITFTLNDGSFIAGVDNGLQTSMESFKANHRKAFNGLCMVAAGSSGKPGIIELTANSPGLAPATIQIRTR